MPKKKTSLETALGKLISAIQKEWGEELGLQGAEITEDVMGAAHKMLQARSEEKIHEILGPMTVRQFLGEVWIQAHPRVNAKISVVEKLLTEGEPT